MKSYFFPDQIIPTILILKFKNCFNPYNQKFAHLRVETQDFIFIMIMRVKQNHLISHNILIKQILSPFYREGNQYL